MTTKSVENPVLQHPSLPKKFLITPQVGTVKTDETGFGGFGTMSLVQFIETFGTNQKIVQYHFRI
jgi:hypothetical protein